jgi:hypothetical protein
MCATYPAELRERADLRQALRDEVLVGFAQRCEASASLSNSHQASSSKSPVRTTGAVAVTDAGARPIPLTRL